MSSRFTKRKILLLVFVITNITLVILASLFICSNPRSGVAQTTIAWLNSIDFDSFEYPTAKPIPVVTRVWNFVTQGQGKPILVHHHPQVGKWILKGQQIPHLDEQLRFYAQNPKTNLNLPEITFALGYIGGPRNTECLLGLLKSKDSRVRLHAVMALGKIRDKRCLMSLKQTALEDPNIDVRANAVDALFSIDLTTAQEIACYITQKETNGFLNGVVQSKLSQYNQEKKP